MLTSRIGKTVYTRNMDGTAEKWYLEKILDDGTSFLRKSPRPKWIDAKMFFLTSDVYETRKAALAADHASRKA